MRNIAVLSCLLLLACGSSAPQAIGPGPDGGAAATSDGGTAVALQGLEARDAAGVKIGIVLGLQQNGVLELWQEDLQALMYVQMATGFVTQPRPILFATSACGGTAYAAVRDIGGADRWAPGPQQRCAGVSPLAASGIAVLFAQGGAVDGSVLGARVMITSPAYTDLRGAAWLPTSMTASLGDILPSTGTPGVCADWLTESGAGRVATYCVQELHITALPSRFATPLRLQQPN